MQSWHTCISIPNSRIDGIGLLHIAVINESVETIHKLVKIGVDINRRVTGTRYTPLYFAVETKNLETVSLLLSNSADVE